MVNLLIKLILGGIASVGMILLLKWILKDDEPPQQPELKIPPEPKTKEDDSLGAENEQEDVEEGQEENPLIN